MPHSAFYATECPGKYFPLVKLLSEVKIMDKELIAALNIFQALGAIKSPDYWLANAQPGKLVKGEYARTFMLQLAQSVAQLQKK
jgi:hypothetical protein